MNLKFINSKVFIAVSGVILGSAITIGINLVRNKIKNNDKYDGKLIILPNDSEDGSGYIYAELEDFEGIFNKKFVKLKIVDNLKNKTKVC